MKTVYYKTLGVADTSTGKLTYGFEVMTDSRGTYVVLVDKSLKKEDSLYRILLKSFRADDVSGESVEDVKRFVKNLCKCLEKNWSDTSVRRIIESFKDNYSDFVVDNSKEV